MLPLANYDDHVTSRLQSLSRILRHVCKAADFIPFSCQSAASTSGDIHTTKMLTFMWCVALCISTYWQKLTSHLEKQATLNELGTEWPFKANYCDSVTTSNFNTANSLLYPLPITSTRNPRLCGQFKKNQAMEWFPGTQQRHLNSSERSTQKLLHNSFYLSLLIFFISFFLLSSSLYIEYIYTYIYSQYGF